MLNFCPLPYITSATTTQPIKNYNPKKVNQVIIFDQTGQLAVKSNLKRYFAN
jgi:hypothetical protein